MLGFDSRHCQSDSAHWCTCWALWTWLQSDMCHASLTGFLVLCTVRKLMHVYMLGFDSCHCQSDSAHWCTCWALWMWLQSDMRHASLTGFLVFCTVRKLKCTCWAFWTSLQSIFNIIYHNILPRTVLDYTWADQVLPPRSVRGRDKKYAASCWQSFRIRTV